ncbi:SIR2 family protein, partial [bacterium]|nr:SIR2 family protein [bacterium]
MSQNQSISTIENIEENGGNIRRLVEQLKTPVGVIPFVGAGLSIPFGFPGWTDFLLTQGRLAGIEKKIKEHIEKGEYEEAAESLLNTLKNRAFQDYLEDAFGDHKLEGKKLKGAISLLPQLASGPVITTNFDHVLEKIFEFERVVWGPKVDITTKALQQKGRYLFKIHGDVIDRTDRVLTLTEYQKHYGNIDPSKIDHNLPLPNLLELIFKDPVLFVGCSLNKDRTLDILKKVALKHGGIALYAIVEKPDNEREFHQKVSHLSEHNIRPIWYPKGRHDLIEPFFAYLIEETKKEFPKKQIDKKRDFSFITLDTFLDTKHYNPNREDMEKGLIYHPEI